MATHAYIGYRTPNGRIKYVYNHYDGYVRGGLGEELVKNYRTEQEVSDLVKQGDMSFPGDPYHMKPGEEWEMIKPKYCSDIDCYRWDAKSNGIYYVYLFDDGEWYLVNIHKKDGNLRPVVDRL